MQTLTIDVTEDFESPEDFSLPTSEIVNDRFRLVSELGRGGMAVVYLAEELSSGRQVALKMMSTRLTGSAKQRFTREFSTIASLKHRHLIEVFEYGESHSGPFFVMELFAGKAATAMTGAPLPSILEALYKLSEAVDFVHSKRIIHRDIKPSNILVRTSEDGSGFDIRLADFGLAKFANTSSTLTGDANFLGTIAYCAPEQIMREELDHRADLYSLGLVVYEVLSGFYPFHESRGDVHALISNQLTAIPRGIREFNRNLSINLERAIMGLIAKEPESRPNSTLELRQALAHELGWSSDVEAGTSVNSAGYLTVPFTARDNELRQLESFAERNLSGSLIAPQPNRDMRCSSSIFFVTGDAGIGKTSLIKRAARAAFAGGAKIYDGRCFDGNLAPFQPFLEIIKQILSEQEKFRRRIASADADDGLASTTFLQAGSATTSIDAVIEGHALDLLRCGADLEVLLANKLPPNFHEVPRDNEYVFRSIANFFVELSKIQPILLFIEDIHWADKSSAKLLRHIASQTVAERKDATSHGGRLPRLAIFSTSRNATEYSKTIAFVDELCEADLASKLLLKPLSGNDCQQLVASQLNARSDEIDRHLVAVLEKQCLGNPFYICQTVREWKLEQRIVLENQLWKIPDRAAPGDGALPESVKEALKLRLRKLPERTAQTLAVAAAIGSMVDVDVLQSLNNSSSDFEFFDIIDDLLAREILRETGKARVLVFAHDLLREATLANLSLTRRQGIHQAIGEFLERRQSGGKYVSYASLAEHFLASGQDVKAFRYLLLAGREATDAYAHVDAISLLLRAKQLTPHEACPRDKFMLCECYGRSLAALDRSAESLDEFESALEFANGPAEFATAHLGIARHYQRIGNLHAAALSYQKSLAYLGEAQPRFIISYLFGMMWSGFVFHVFPNWLARSKEPAAGHDLKKLASEVYGSYCCVVVQINLIGYIYSSIRNALLAKHANSPDLVALAYSKYAFNLALSGRLGAILSKGYIRKSAELLGKCTSPFVRALTLQNLGGASYFQGDLVKADQYFLEAQPILENSKDWHLAFNYHMRRHIASQRGDATEIEDLARRELSFGERINDPITQSWAMYGLADGLSRQGRFSQGVAYARESEILLVQSNDYHLTHCVALQELGRALIQSSQHAEAEVTLRQGLRLLRFYMDFSVQTFSLYPEAILGPQWAAGPQGVSKDRRKRAARAAFKARFWAWSFPNMEAHTYRISGRVAGACGSRRRAIKFFERSLAAADKYGNRGEYARALVDMSKLMVGEAARTSREQGLRLLAELNSVLPEAEMTDDEMNASTSKR